MIQWWQTPLAEHNCGHFFFGHILPEKCNNFCTSEINHSLGKVLKWREERKGHEREEGKCIECTGEERASFELGGL
jgi:non-homologous end joining protein Ku